MGAEEGPITMLIGVASRHGATREIAEVLAQKLFHRGIDAVVHDAATVRSFSGYDGAIIGSAVYMGHWLKPAQRLAERYLDEAGSRPLWLFSSGPAGAAAAEGDEPSSIQPLLAAPQVRGHHTFAGKVERDRLGPLEKLAVHLAHVPEGDFRSWADIDAWADQISQDLVAPVGAATPR